MRASIVLSAVAVGIGLLWYQAAPASRGGPIGFAVDGTPPYELTPPEMTPPAAEPARAEFTNVDSRPRVASLWTPHLMRGLCSDPLRGH